ncbi:MAG TPA: AAA family ATPase, partial [Chloroflexota bacterium]|nr:AAA family ATPase [Chloroflexota bacterium]
MHLKRLELLGFKSFANKTVLELDQGVTAIVGPNGSGKSNVVDAVRWALGEQSLRAVRSKKSDEVIFAGNSKRAPVGMAEVTLVLDNSDSSLPLAFSEVSVTRRQYRSGEGEYLINRSRARLKDVVELLTHANLGPDAYAVVSQGAVDEVLLQRPEERRALLETAADIARHQLKLKESLDRLSETNGNLQRVEDIQSEITPQLSRLRIQASRARRYEEVAERLRHSLQWRYLLQVRQAVQRTEVALAGERERAQAVGESSRSLELLRHRVSAAREQLREQERSLEASRERLANLRLAKARGDRELALAREREASHRRELREAEEELASAQKEHRDLETEMARLRTSRTAMAARETEARSAMEPVEAERRRAQAEMRIVQAQLDRSASDRQGGATRRSELQERCNALQRQLKRAEEGRGESEEAARAASARLAQLEQEIGALAAEMETLRTAVKEFEARRQEVQRSLAELAARTEAARRRERASWERDSHLRNRLSLLQSLRNENRGMPTGTRKLLEAGLPGIRGVLASIIQVPQQYVTAVAAALGSAQTHLVSDGFQEALYALGTLQNGSGRATVSPLRLEEHCQREEPIRAFRSGLNGTMDGLGFHGFASDLVSPEPGAEELCARYLGLTMVVETLADAVELFQRLNRHTGGTMPFQVVTVDGRLLRARGDMSSAPAPDK